MLLCPFVQYLPYRQAKSFTLVLEMTEQEAKLLFKVTLSPPATISVVPDFSEAEKTRVAVENRWLNPRVTPPSAQPKAGRKCPRAKLFSLLPPSPRQKYLESPEDGRNQGRFRLSVEELFRLRCVVSEHLRSTAPQRR